MEIHVAACALIGYRNVVGLSVKCELSFHDFASSFPFLCFRQKYSGFNASFVISVSEGIYIVHMSYA